MRVITTTRVFLEPHRLYQSCRNFCSMAQSKNHDIALDSFAYRQFDDADYAGTKIPVSKEDFMKHVHAFYNERKQMQEEYGDRPALIDGYAPFCKHLFMPNFDDRIIVGEIAITSHNEHLLRSRYYARKKGELPVLTRFFPKDNVSPPVAKYLDLIRTFIVIAHLCRMCTCDLLRHRNTH